MARTKATVRLPVKTQRLPGWMVNREYGKKKTIYPFKIKEILAEQKSVKITKNGQIVKTINVRRKSRYFNGRNRLIFQCQKIVNLKPKFNIFTQISFFFHLSHKIGRRITNE